MSKTEVSGKQVKDGSIELVDLSTALSNTISGKADASSLATVATSGSYDDLSNKPSIPSVAGLASETYVDNAVAGKADSSSLATVATSGAYADLTGKPTLFDGAYSSLTGAPSIPANLDDLSDVTLTSPSNGQVLSYNGTAWVNSAAPSSFSGSYSDLTNKPTIPSAFDDLSDVAVSSAAKGQFIVHNGTSFVNARTIEANAATTVPLTLKGAASQSANYLDIKDSANNNVLYIDSGKQAVFYGTGNFAGGSGAGSPCVLIQGALESSYTTGWPTITAGIQTTSGVQYPRMMFTGDNGSYIDFVLRNQNSNWSSRIWATPGGINIGTSHSGNRGYPASFSGFNNPALTLAPLLSTAKGLVVQAAASQSANLFEVQDSAATVLATITSGGKFGLGNSSPNMMIDVQDAGGYTVGGGDFKAAAVFQKSTSNKQGIILGYDNSATGGGIIAGSANTSGTPIAFWTYSNTTSSWAERARITDAGYLGVNSSSPGAQFQVNAAAATTKGMIVKGAASQTESLFETQDSTGAWKSRFQSDGTLRFNYAASTTPILVSNFWNEVMYSVNIGANSATSNSYIRIGTQVYQFTEFGWNGTNGCFHIWGRNHRVFSMQSPDDGAGVYTFDIARNTGSNTWEISSGNRSFNMKTATTGGVGINTAPSASFHTLSTSTTRKGMIVQGAASQTANLFEAQNSSGTALTTIASDGTVHAARYTETVANAFDSSLAPSTGTLTVNTALGNAVLGALSASVTTWAFTNVPTDNSKVTTVTAVLAGNASYTYGDACSVNGSAVTNGVMWSGGSAPTATAGTDIITFIIVKDSAGTVKVFGSATTNFS